MKHLLKTCPLTQLMHIALWWQKRQIFRNASLKIGPARKVNKDEKF